MELIIEDLKDGQVKVIKALSSVTRWKILKILANHGPIDVTTIAEMIPSQHRKGHQSEANICEQVQILEKAGLITSQFIQGKRGAGRKMCELKVRKVIMILWRT